jgi:hypothetical protein
MSRSYTLPLGACIAVADSFLCFAHVKCAIIMSSNRSVFSSLRALFFFDCLISMQFSKDVRSTIWSSHGSKDVDVGNRGVVGRYQSFGATKCLHPQPQSRQLEVNFIGYILLKNWRKIVTKNLIWCTVSSRDYYKEFHQNQTHRTLKESPSSVGNTDFSV